jgi:hypothetical protein
MLVCLAMAVGGWMFNPAHAQEPAERKAGAEQVNAPAEQQGTTPDKAKEPAKAASAKTARADDVVCTREKETGSRMSKQVCVSRAEAEARRRESEDAVRDAKRTGQIGNASGG